MFRLVKVLNGNNQYETVRLKNNGGNDIKMGCMLMHQNGTVAFPSATTKPHYLALKDTASSESGIIDVMMINDNMVFKVEYTGSANPFLGMSVGLANLKGKMDAVTYNTNGKGTIIEIDDDNHLVYVRFHR